MLEFVQGDMFETPADIRVNTVNCVGVMGAGVALAFKQRYPEMFRDYQRACEDGQVRPGVLHVWRSLAGDWIINFPTKRHWRDDSRYEDIEVGLDALREYLEPLGSVSVALPALGCGHGGLDWDRVSSMIERKLDGLAAEVRVYAPAQSRQAGRKAVLEPTSDELKSAEQLGYFEALRSINGTAQSDGSIYLKGRASALYQRWMAVMPSRSPSARELSALSSIATELARRGNTLPVALVYGSKATEEIAELFIEAEIETVLLLPFGVLTRRSLAKLASVERRTPLTLASIASLSAKWSPALFAQSVEFLRANAAAVLLSDPEPDWLNRPAAGKWGQLPFAYIRYEGTSDTTRKTLAGMNAVAVGRRSNSGAPNLDALLGTRTLDETIEAAGGEAHEPEALSQPGKLKVTSGDGHRDMLVRLSDFPEDLWTDVMEAVRQAAVGQTTLQVVANQAAAELLERRLGKLREHAAE